MGLEEFNMQSALLALPAFAIPKEAVRAQAACPGAWRKGFSGSGEALNLFSLVFLKSGVTALDELVLQLVNLESRTVGLLSRALRVLRTVSLQAGLDQGTISRK